MPESNRFMLQELTWPEVKDAIRKNTILVLVVGSVEQHGPHLPLGVDTYIPLELAKLLAKRRRLLIAPPITYGAFSRPKSGGGQSFVGTTSLTGSILTEIVKKLVGEYVRQGFKKIIVLNGHFENSTYVTEGVESAVGSAKGVKALIVNWWDIVPECVLSSIFPEGFPGWEVEHASVTETSLMQFFMPELVRSERIIDDRAPRSLKYEIVPSPEDIKPKSGVLWKATLASQENGRQLAAAIVDELSAIIKKEFA